MSNFEYTPQELAALKKEHAANATDEQFKLWIAECRSRNLAPVRDILMQIRTSERWDPEVRAKVKEKKSVYIVTIGAKRKIANATGLYAGQLPTKWIYLDSNKQPTVESEIPLPDPNNPSLPLEPWAVRTSVLRKGFDAPLTVVSRFGAYCQTMKRDDKVVPTAIWSAFGRSCEMLEKCSESACLTRAFPSELGGLYIKEELDKEEVVDAVPVEPVVVTEAPKAPVVPQIDHTPVAPTNEPRPNEKKEKPAKDTTLAEVIAQKAEPVSSVIVEEGKKQAKSVQKMDEPKPKPTKDNNTRLRDLIDIVGGGDVFKKALQQYLLQSTGAAKVSEIPVEQLEPLLVKLEGLDKTQLVAEVTKKEEV